MIFLISLHTNHRDTSKSVNAQRLKDISTHLETLSSLCGELMTKCQHSRIKQVPPK